MTAILDDFLELQRKVAKLQQERDKAAGALEELLQQLKREFDCGSVEEGEALLEKLRKRERKSLQEYLTAKREFEDRWGDRLGTDSKKD